MTLRLLQGLALGGEYGGAAIYVAEHAPDNKRGLYTSWIQTTATVGLFAGAGDHPDHPPRHSATRRFRDWGWRVPFLLSAVLVVVALYIRLQLQETPLFHAAEGAGQDVDDRRWARRAWAADELGVILLVLFGMTAGQAVVWYQGQFQALIFLTVYLKVDSSPRVHLMLIATRARHAVLHLLRLAVGQDRPQADHPRRLPARGDHLRADLSGDDRQRQR